MRYKVLMLAISLFAFFSNTSFSQSANNYTVELARMFSKDLFESNGIPFLQPVVTVVNGTSNTRFFNQAFIPTKVEKPYFRVGLQNMLGFVGNDLKSYTPVMPSDSFSYDKAFSYIELSGLNIKSIDTAGLVRYLFLNLMYDGVYVKKSIKIPAKASTALGSGNQEFFLPHDTLHNLLQAHPLYSNPLIPQSLKDSISASIGGFPEKFALYGGSDLSTVYAAIPQIEIGSLFGTELLLRFIPSVNLGESIGDFSFWGIGLKHSISQYFGNNYLDSESERPFDMAVQAVYQGTNLKNTVGVTKADLNADATMYNFNVHFSKSFSDIIDIYSGFSYEMIEITSTYKYELPIEIQWQLGLIDKISDENPNFEPTPGFPGDKNPQVSKLSVSDNNFKWTIGARKAFGNFAIFIDYNVSNFNIFSGGLEYTF